MTLCANAGSPATPTLPIRTHGPVPHDFRSFLRRPASARPVLSLPLAEPAPEVPPLPAITLTDPVPAAPSALPELDPCVHCGFCLQACPTFLATGDEADSPRGRIVLMRQLADGRLPPDSSVALRHLDRCLGCRACETACPSGVEYGHALEQMRARTAVDRPPSPAARLVLAVMAARPLRRPALALARMVRPLARRLGGGSPVGFALGSLGATRSRWPRRVEATPADGHDDARQASRDPVPPRGPAVLFTGCIMEGLFDHVHRATLVAGRVNGYRWVEAPRQGCCGALHAHAGRREEARALARMNVAAFADSPDATIVVNSAGCGAMLRDYGHLLAGDPLHEAATRFAERVRDVSEVLAAAGPVAGAPLPLRVAYDPPCHLCHAQRVTDAPEAVLAAIPGLRRVRHHEAEACCGSAGLYSVEQRTLSRQVLDRKLDRLEAVEPEVVVTGNPGCTMHIGAGLRARGRNTPVLHPVELLAVSYRRAGLDPG